MGRTRVQLRQETARQTSLPFLSGTATATTGTTLTDLPVLGRAPDNSLTGVHLFLPNESDEQHHVTSSNVQSTGIATFTPSVASYGDSTPEYEMLPFAADAIHAAIDEALMVAYDRGLLVRKHWCWAVSGSPIYNADMGYWTSSSALHGWTATTSTLARSQAAANKWVGENVAQLTTASGNLRLDPTWARFLAEMAGSSVRVNAWMNGSSAGANRAAILENGSSVANTGNHEGDSDWHVVSSSFVTLTQSETDITVQVERAAGTSMCSLIWIEGGAFPDLHPIPIALFPEGPTAIYSYPMDLDTANTRATIFGARGRPLSGWDWRRYHDEAANVEMGVLEWKRRPAPHRLLRIEGDGPFTLPTTETGVVELNQMEGLLIAKMAAIILLERSMQAGSPRWAVRIDRLARDVERLAEGMGSSQEAVTLGPTW